MTISFSGYVLQNEGIKPMQNEGAQRKADTYGKGYLFHDGFQWLLVTLTGLTQWVQCIT